VKEVLLSSALPADAARPSPGVLVQNYSAFRWLSHTTSYSLNRHGRLSYTVLFQGTLSALGAYLTSGFALTSRINGGFHNQTNFLNDIVCMCKSLPANACHLPGFQPFYQRSDRYLLVQNVMKRKWDSLL
jgi:hypothetical protein